MPFLNHAARLEARQRGSKTFTLACIHHGDGAIRLVSSGTCIKCDHDKYVRRQAAKGLTVPQREAPGREKKSHRVKTVSRTAEQNKRHAELEAQRRARALGEHLKLHRYVGAQQIMALDNPKAVTRGRNLDNLVRRKFGLDPR